MTQKDFCLVPERLDSFKGLLLGSMNIVSLRFNFCSVAWYYDATILLGATILLPRFCWSKACNSSSSLNYSLRSSKCLMRIKLWQFNKTMHQWSFLPPDYITQFAEYVSLGFFYLYPSIFLWIHGYVLHATNCKLSAGREEVAHRCYFACTSAQRLQSSVAKSCYELF